MAVDSRQQSHINGLSYGYAGPHFSNPWGAAPSVSSAPYAATQAPSPALNSQPQLQQRNLTLPPYSAIPVTTALGSGPSLLAGSFGHPSNVSQQQYPQYTTAGPTGYTSVTAPGYISIPDNRAAGFGFSHNDARRPSHSFSGGQRDSFADVVDASRQMLSLGQNDITPTPRNMYGTQTARSTPESYGFPATHSNHSSISTASGVHSNYGSSVGDYALSDYSSASESVDLNHRTLPRPSGSSVGSGHGMPPAPQSMMGQFSSKVSSSTQKKHKCKVCDKRFTRPSSLQTHIYSHTGEKPFACEVEGCGRHFSVVSNLRRHKKVHKNSDDSISESEVHSPEE